MSSRALKRLERQRIEELVSERGASLDDLEDGSSDHESVQQQKTSFNAFAILNEGSEEELVEEEEEEEEEAIEKEQTKATKVSVSELRSVTSKKSKSKKKKNKKRIVKELLDSDEELDKILEEAKRKDKERVSQSKESSMTPQVESYEDIYDFEEELDQIVPPTPDYDSNFKHFTLNRLQQSLSLLNIGSVKSLDPDQEFRNLFGNLSMETIEDANTTTSLSISPEVLQQFKKLARLTRGWGGKDRRSIPGTSRKLLLTRIRDDWLPSTQKPITMEELKFDEIINYLDYKEESAELKDMETKVKKEISSGVNYFKFNKVNTVQERVANSRFFASVVMTSDPESLMQLLQQYPYHVETLLQVAMILLRQGNDKSTSNALVEKCLFVFDRTFHKKLHELLSEGKTGLIRLPYESFSNRQFYLCLFRYIMNLGERSTYFTALSYCKFLLSLSPAEDPLGVRYFIDYYAIMSEEYEYLTKFVKSPLATTYEKWMTPGLAFSSSLAHLHLDDVENAKKALKSAYEKYPYVSFKLLELIGLSHNIPVRETEIPINDEILIASETYLTRASLLWNDHPKRQFLHDELLKLFQTQSIKKSSKKSLTSSIYNILDFQKKNPNNEIPFNLVRFAILSGENKIMARIPNEIWSRDDLYEYDVLPPRDTTTRYSEFTGVDSKLDKIVDSLFDYVDQNVIGSIVQNRTEEEDFAEIIRHLQLQEQEEHPIDGGNDVE